MAFKIGINSQQLGYFRCRLILCRDELATESTGTAYDDGKDAFIDVMGQAANAANSSATFRSQDRKQKLARKIDESLNRINAGTYEMT